MIFRFDRDVAWGFDGLDAALHGGDWRALGWRAGAPGEKELSGEEKRRGGKELLQGVL